MNEESKRLKQYVIDAIVGGNLDRLGPSLASLWTVDPGEYLALTCQLIDTVLPKQTTTLGIARDCAAGCGQVVLARLPAWLLS